MQTFRESHSPRFNPTLVRLRQIQNHRPEPPLPGFNPTLVRLRRVSLPRRPTKRASSFQSHAGSIEAAREALAQAVLSPVSIPRWFD